jgi:protein TonB
MQVDLTPPPRPPPPPEAKEPEPPQTPEPAPKAAPPKAAQNRAPAPAAAGKLLTADPSAAGDAPVDFVIDPNGGAYGFGVVARGGSTERREGIAAPIPTTPVAVSSAQAVKSDGLTPAADLSEKPRLVSDDPCKGYYPSEALVDSAAAVVRVIVESDGRTRTVQLVSETPAGQGFGNAARNCLRTQRWSPARDHDGKAVPTATTFRVRFHR